MVHGFVVSLCIVDDGKRRKGRREKNISAQWVLVPSCGTINVFFVLK